MGDYFTKTFAPTMRRLVEAGLSYEGIKRAVRIPSTWGAKISAEQFEERAKKALEQRRD